MKTRIINIILSGEDNQRIEYLMEQLDHPTVAAAIRDAIKLQAHLVEAEVKGSQIVISEPGGNNLPIQLKKSY